MEESTLPASRPARVLLVCDAYPTRSTDESTGGARDKVAEWQARGAEVLVLAGNPQPPGSLSAGYAEIEEVWIDRVTVYQVRFALPVRRRSEPGHGAEPVLRLVLEGTLRQFRPDVLCVVLGPLFGAIPLRKAAEHRITVEMVDRLSILRDVSATHPRRRPRRRRRRTPASLDSTEHKAEPRLRRMLRRGERG